MAIEEQFYLVWPTIVKWLNRQRLVVMGLATILLSLAARLILVADTNDFAYIKQVVYFITFTRLDGLMVGALIALALESKIWTAGLRQAAWPILGFSLLTLAFMTRSGSEALADNPPMSTWGYALLAITGGALIILVTTQPEAAWIRILFRTPILRFFGKYSYAMYLLHLPLILVISDYYIQAGRISGAVCLTYMILVFVSTIMLSLLSWHLVEKHVLSLKKNFA